ncbi:MAG: sulfite exporter TauE/SafE family protein [Deltaproteobacteria bacterium]|nr:sulfite exporter TauE/SafE family protein [Deltaproteobacteria bacterium]
MSPADNNIKLILLGFGVALFSACIGIGGGTLLVSLLMSIFNFDFKKAAATSLATIIPISFTGAVVGSIISGNLPGPIIKKIFGIFLFLIALNYIIEAFYRKHGSVI